VVYDALFVGVPVVVLDFGAFKDLVAEGFAEGVKSLAEADIADALLRATEKTYARISMDGNAFLDWKTYSDRLIDVYEKLIGT
jgi:glycosyltransferase involved in cell wall biosynthesis